MKWIKSIINKVKIWDKNYFSIFLDNNISPFLGGQFTKLGLKTNSGFYSRFYSFMNSYKDKELEFFLKKKKGGYFSNLLFYKSNNSIIYISKYSYGKFIIKNINNKNILWMLCIGTSISPFLSILKSDFQYIKKKFKKIFFLYGVKYFKNIYFLNQLIYFKKKYGLNYLNLFFFISREINIKYFNKFKLNIISGHINNFFLEKKFYKYINNNSHFMICGNCNMVNNITNFLRKKFLIYTDNFSIEKY